MIARWDVLLVAAVLSGGSVMIENSHRVDTGLADDAAATALPICAEAVADRPDAASASDDGDGHFAVSAAYDDAALTACE